MVRRYSGNLSSQQVTVLRQVLAGDIGNVPPGVKPPDAPGVDPPGHERIFNDDIQTLPVAPENLPGIEDWAARVDHQHEGVHSLAALGMPSLFGDVTLSVGGLLTLTQIAQNLHLDLDASSLLAHRVVERYQLLAGSPTSFTTLFDPVGEVAVYFDGFRKHQNLHYGQVGRQITLSSDVSLLNGDLLLFDYFYTVSYGSQSVTPSENPGFLDFSVTDQSGLWAVI